MKTSKDVQAEINVANKETQRLHEEYKRLLNEEIINRNDKMTEVATVLHECLCAYNHTDGCSWGYEGESNNKWLSYAHASWLEKAQKLADEFGAEEVLKMVNMINDMKKACPAAPLMIRTLFRF
jgi:hypothetical protein